MSHHCHARGCSVQVKPELLMCRKHWFMVPRDIRDAVWRSYRPGQCDDKNPSKDWHTAADAAIGYVAIREELGTSPSERVALARFGRNPETGVYWG